MVLSKSAMLSKMRSPEKLEGLGSSFSALRKDLRVF